jgi:hypothetical protein
MREYFAVVESCVDMNAKRRELVTIWLLASICAVAALAAGHEILAVVFLLQSGIAGFVTFL